MALTDDQVEELLEELEAGLREEVQAALTLTANDFAEAVEQSTELVAAAFSVSRIGAMWRRRVGGLMDHIRRIARRGSQVAADDLEETVPPVSELNEELDRYFEEVQLQLDEVGVRLSSQAVTSLAEGVAAGETQDELKQRMLTLFSDTGSQLGPTRAERIAQTEATSAFNAGTLAAARTFTGPERPLVKQWLTRNDERVRQAHRDTNGQLQLLDDPFDVGGTPMQFPGDPTAPADLTINCRCIMRTATAERTASVEEVTAAAEIHTGAMIALMPDPADAARLALDGGEDVDQLHVTLAYLGEAADWDLRDQIKVLAAVQLAVGRLTPVDARTFGVAQWNPHSENPCWIYNVGDDQDTPNSSLGEVHREVLRQLEESALELPRQHSPWVPHIAGVYGDVGEMLDMVDRLGPVSFDRIRVAFAGENVDFPLVDAQADYDVPDEQDECEDAPMDYASTVTWSTPGTTALAFENQQTGDGRVFAPGALYWSGAGPWPLQYADEMMGGHDGAQLAGAINTLSRDGGRIPGSGVLYMSQPAGCEAALLLAQGAPLGVSVDLDDVDLEMVSTTPGSEGTYKARLLCASLLPTEAGGFFLTCETMPEMSASSGAALISSQRVNMVISPDGTVPASLLDLVAAAGDPDTGGAVLDRQRSGDVIMRITRGRIRGATLVTIPAYADARIVLDDASMFASVTDEEVSAAIKSETDYDRVLRHVRRSKDPVGSARLAQFLKMPIAAAQRLLALAASRGEVVRLARGLYTDKTTSAKADHVMLDDLTASVTGAVDLPVASRDHEWDGDAATGRVFDWADGDADKISKAYAYRDDDKDPLTKAAYKLGYADVVNGELTIIPKGVSAAIGAVNGARGGVDLPAGERAAVADRLEAVRAHVSEETGEDEMDDMQASAWKAMQDLPAMPAEWFREPTPEELPPGGPGVNYANGRIFGWVAQAGEPHAGFAKKITIDTLGRIDTSHFLRQRFHLDDGSTVKAGAYTMNVGHHRDGAECETSACQFDDTRTVAGIVTVGMNERGMWFSGAAAPWLSEWDRRIFAATQPSYHMKKSASGGWQLRAVLGVPVPGHSSPLLASAVIERAQVALTAAATMADVEEAIATEEAAQAVSHAPAGMVDVTGLADAIDYDKLADALTAAAQRAEARKATEAAELAELLAMAEELTAADTMGDDVTGTEEGV